MSIDITQQVQPIVTQAVHDAAQQLEARLTALENQAAPVVAAEVAAIAPQLGTTLLSTGQAILNNAIHDVWLPRMFLGFVGSIILALIIGCEAHSQWALNSWAAVFPLGAAGVGVVARMVLNSATGKTPIPPTPGA